MSFNVGDKVVCVNADGRIGITPHHTYTIRNTSPRFVQLEEGNHNAWYYTHRFKLAPTESPIPNRVLEAAKAILEGNRNETNGTPEDNFSTIADYWKVYLKSKGHEVDLNALDVALMMDLLKTARIRNGQPMFDHFVDKVGYSALGAMVGAKV